MRRLRQLLLAVQIGLISAGAVEASPAPARLAQTPAFRLPVACTLGETCWIQHYVDRDPSSAAKDFTCGSLTYDGHNGTDIRVADMATQRRGVNVLAAAPGVVLRLRDSMSDVSVRAAGLESVDGVECGNGLIIDHGGGWETQYCHMAKGSLLVKAGEQVAAGQPLGHIGLSGQTEFPHLHFTVRHDGAVVDPFAPSPGAAGSCGAGKALWMQTVPYAPRAVINAGFAPGPVDMAVIEAGNVPKPDSAAPYLVAFVRTIGLRAGDQPSLVVSGPNGETLAPSPPATETRNSAQKYLLVGKKRPSAGWRPGSYHARYEVRVGGAVVLERSFDITL